MRIGIGLETGGTIDEVTARARAIAAIGVECLWTSQIFGWDSLTLLALLGREVPGVDLGTAVVPVHPRHPTTLAAQALTVQAATGGRLQLGIGLSHKVVVEGVWGMSFDHPARYMDEYLSILVPLLEGESVSFNGELLQTNTLGPLSVPATPAPPVLVAALAPAMLGVAGRKASGTVTWMVGLKTLSQHIVPTISAAASASGRPAPRVAVNLPVSVTADREGASQRAERIFSMYGQLPSYRAMLDREGAEGPSSVAIVGDEEHVARSIEKFSDAGATEFSAVAFGAPEDVSRTNALLGELAKH